MTTRLGEKIVPALGFLHLKKRHCALLVIYLEQPNLTPRAFIDTFSGATVTNRKGQQALVFPAPHIVLLCGTDGAVQKIISEEKSPSANFFDTEKELSGVIMFKVIY